MQELWQFVVNWFGNGGEFFTQTLFAVSASMCFSYKVREFLMIPRREQLERLKKRVKAERNMGIVTEKKTQQYEKILEKLKKWDDALDDCMRNTIKTCKRLAWVCLGVSFLLIITGISAYVGFLPLLCFLPFVWARTKLKEVQKEMEADCKTQEAVLDEIKIAYGTEVSRDSADLMGELQTDGHKIESVLAKIRMQDDERKRRMTALLKQSVR